MYRSLSTIFSRGSFYTYGLGTGQKVSPRRGRRKFQVFVKILCSPPIKPEKLVWLCLEIWKNSSSIHNGLKNFMIPLLSIFLPRYKNMQRPLPLIKGIQNNGSVSNYSPLRYQRFNRRFNTFIEKIQHEQIETNPRLVRLSKGIYMLNIAWIISCYFVIFSFIFATDFYWEIDDYFR